MCLGRSLNGTIVARLSTKQLAIRGRALTSDPQGGPPQPNDLEEALHEQREWLQVTLSGIGDAVISTDVRGNVTFMNPVAQALTGWTSEEAVGGSLAAVYKIVNEETRQTAENPATRTLREGLVLGLANHTLLIAKDGTERLIEDSAAPYQKSTRPDRRCGLDLP